MNNISPSHLASQLAIEYSSSGTTEKKKNIGQFFTPLEISAYMASLCNVDKDNIKILDPGCGTTILSCSLIEYIVSKNHNLKSIELVCYEIDSELISKSHKSLQYLKLWLHKKGIQFQYIIHVYDFILSNATALYDDIFHNNDSFLETFDIVISNPPFFKLSKDDERSKAAKIIINGQPNIYSIFMGISAKLLNENGELIFITPRSFASGDYFRVFRDIFFNTVQLRHLHLFHSRKDPFNKDNVLQELLILKAVKEKNMDENKEDKVFISSSKNINDLSRSEKKTFIKTKLLNLSSKEKILHLPTNKKEENILNLILNWNHKLIDYDIQISTGPVVSFRASKYLKNGINDNVAPLFWLHNVKKMFLEWPSEFKNKNQYIQILPETKNLLLPNKNYIFLRRFSTKDDKSRLIASPYLADDHKSNYIGVENKLNYIYKLKGKFEKIDIIGLCALLNSDLFNTYFQIFNGNVNVSATELRSMKFPPFLDTKKIGQILLQKEFVSMEYINELINNYFKIENIAA